MLSLCPLTLREACAWVERNTVTERNPIWSPIAYPRPGALWSSVGEIIEAYQRAERPVRVSVSQRYSLVVTEPREER